MTETSYCLATDSLSSTNRPFIHLKFLNYIMKKFCNVLTLVMVGVMLFSCNNDKSFEDAVSILGSIPVFMDDNKVNQSASLENNNVVLSFHYSPNTEWGKAIGDNWVPILFMKQLLGQALAGYTLGSVLKAEEGEYPVGKFLDMMDEKNASFELKYNNKSKVLSPTEVRTILEETNDADVTAQYFGKQMEQFANDFNGEATQSIGYYMKSATMEDANQYGNYGTLYININYKGIPLTNLNSPISTSSLESTLENSLFMYSSIPAYCYLSKNTLAFRCHHVDDESLLTTNELFNNSTDYVFYIDQEKLKAKWDSMQEQANQN